jgi:polyprenyl-phospho-N-acetylgalactosaminyl synthase
MKIFCVIPAFNEEKNIATTAINVLNYVDHLVIVDDCSNDKTINEIKKIKNEKISLVEHPINLGQGAALETGNKYALKRKADIIVHFDGDGQFLAEEIKKVTKPILEKDYDIVFGSRFLDIKSNIPKFKKNIIIPMAKIFNQIFFKIKTSDPQSGFRAMKAEIAEKIKIENDRMAHCTEILAKAYKNKFKIQEVSITVIYEEFGQKFSGGLKIIKDLIFKKISK